MPQAVLGETMEPSVSVPSEKPDQPGGGADPDPADEPEEPRSYSPLSRAALVGQGLLVRPWNHRSPCAKAPIDSLADQDGAGLVEAVHAGGVGIGDAILKGLGAPGGRNALGVEEVLHAERDAVQRSAIVTVLDLGIGGGGLFERQFLGEGDQAEQSWASTSSCAPGTSW